MGSLLDRVDVERKIKISAPLSAGEARKLVVGDVVYIDGVIWTCRSNWHKRAIDQGVEPPIDIRNRYNVMMHCGPAVKRNEDGTWSIKAVVPTASLRYGTWTPQVLERFGVRAIIGKGGMQEALVDEFRKHGAVYLLGVGNWIGAWYASKIERVIEVHWMDLGLPEATWVFEAKDFGPFVVAIDSEGRSLYREINERINERLQVAYQKLGYDIIMKRVGEVSPIEEVL